MISELKAGVSKGYIDYVRKGAIEKALKAPEDVGERNRLIKWYSRIHSSDPEVVAKLFRKEWKQFDRLIESSEDKAKLKKKFGIR